MSKKVVGTGAVYGGGVGEDFIPEQAQGLKKIAIFGHSYTSRFRVDKPLLFPGHYLQLFDVPGGKVSTIKSTGKWQALLSYAPELTILMLGGNDITENTTPKDLALEIEQLVKEIEEATRGHCLIIGIESRVRPRGLSAETFNKIKNGVNRWLKRLLPYTRSRYHSMCMHKEELVDGVHLTLAAQDNLFKRVIQISMEFFGVD